MPSETQPDADFWSQARAQMMLDPSAANLNTGSFGPLPRIVFDEVTRLRQHLAAEPMDFLVRESPPLLCQARERLAAFIGGDATRLAFTVNVTAAINTVASSLRLASPGEILLTDHEYGAMHWCWERAAQRQGLTLRTFKLPTMPKSPVEIVDAAVAAFTPQTRLFFFSHVLSPTGMVLPAAELCAEARRRGIVTVIDGAHAPAFVPLDMNQIGCDYYGANCHKWLLAPTGTGFLYFAPGADERIQPLQVSWGWHRANENLDKPNDFGSAARLYAFEFEGTRDLCPWLAIPAAIDFQERLGWNRIAARHAELVAYVRSRIGSVPCLRPATPDHPALHNALTAFELPEGTSPAELREHLWSRYRLEAPVIVRPDRTLIRVSTHFYNTKAEIDQLHEALSTSGNILPRR
jgi:isopenicillin-N epimerase